MLKRTTHFLFTCLLVGLVNISAAQSPGDYRSKQTGIWSDATTWQRYNGSNWVNVITSPSLLNGIITIQSGHEITSNVTQTADQVIIKSGGTLSIMEGTFTVAIAGVNDLDCSGTLNLLGGILDGAGNIRFNQGSTFNWTEGTNGGSGIMNINTGGTLNMNGGNVYFADTKTINNYGTWNWTGGAFIFYNGAPLINNFGTFNISTNADQLIFFSAGSFNNKPTGIINKIGSPDDETSFNGISQFTNAGTINVNSGRLTLNINSVNTSKINVAFGAHMNFSNGTAIFNAGTVITGAGSLNFAGGTDSINAASVSVANFNISNGTVIIKPAMTITSGSSFNLSGGTLESKGSIGFNAGSTFNWTGGYNGGSGVMNIKAGADFNMDGGFKALYIADTKTINNYGTWNWTSGSFYFNNGNPVINNYATFNINTDADQYTSFSLITGSFNNRSTGVINKIGSPFDETSFTNLSQFINSGTINVNSGILRLGANSVHTGSINVAYAARLKFSISTTIFKGGSMLKGAGSLDFEGGTDSINTVSLSIKNINISDGTVIITPSITISSGTTLSLSGGTLTGAGVISFDQGSTFNWTGGNNAGNGVMNINAGGDFKMNGGLLYFADTKTINNYGTWNWISGFLYFYNGVPIVNNYGTFNLNCDEAAYGFPTGIFNNMPTGIINKTGSVSGETIFGNFAFTNSGIVNVHSGNLRFNTEGIHGGKYNIDLGAQLRGSIIMPFTGSTFTNNGAVELTGLTFDGGAAQSLNGTGSIYSLTINNSSGVIMGGTQTINNSLTLTKGKVTLGNNNLVLGSAATLFGGSDTAYIVTNGLGSLQRRVLNDNLNVPFPVGSATSYMPAEIQLSDSSIIDNLKVRVTPNIYGSYDTLNKIPVGSAVTASSVKGTWFISENVSGGSNATITLQWNSNNQATGFSRSKSRLGQYKAGIWNLDTIKAPLGTNPFSLSRSNITSFFSFGITNQFITTNNNYATSCAGSSISVPYIAVGKFNSVNIFTAQLSDSAGSFLSPVNIGSKTATSSGNIAATIPGSAIAGSGYKVRVISSSPAFISAPNLTNIRISNCVAPVVLNKDDFEVSAKYDTIFADLPGVVISETLPSKASNESIQLPADKLTIYPNPTNGKFMLELRCKEITSGNVNLMITNMAGQVVHVETIPVYNNRLRKTISLNSSNNNEIYILRILAGKQVYKGKIYFRK